jgi:predicted Zn-dependent protease
MSKNFAIFSLFFALFVSTSFAQETFTNEAAKVSITLPAGWMYEADGTDISAYPKAGGFFVHFSVINADDLTTALGEVDKMLDAQVKNLTLGEAKKYDVNGMNGIFVEGTADGVLMAVGVIDTPVEKSSLFVGAWGAPETVEKYAQDVLSIFNSIAPAK